MNNTKKTLRIKLFILMAAFLLILLSLFTYNRVSSLINTLKKVNEIHLVKYKIEKVKLSLKECETNVRGFALSKDSIFLPQINTSLIAIENSTAVLSKSIHKDQQNNFAILDDLVKKRIVKFKEAILANFVSPLQVLKNRELMEMTERHKGYSKENHQIIEQTEEKQTLLISLLVVFGLLSIIYTIKYFMLKSEIKNLRNGIQN